MGYELAEQFLTEIALPDVILYPTGGGTGLIGMWKAFDEMQQMGWIGSQTAANGLGAVSDVCTDRPAFEKGERFADEFENASTSPPGCACRRRSATF